MGILPERALSGHRNIARTLARTSSPVLLQAEVSQPLMDAVHGWLTDPEKTLTSTGLRVQVDPLVHRYEPDAQPMQPGHVFTQIRQ